MAVSAGTSISLPAPMPAMMFLLNDGVGWGGAGVGMAGRGGTRP